jgi:hypothetical protein
MVDDTYPPFALPAVGRKKITAAFDGGRISSGGGAMLLAQVERRLALVPDRPDPAQITRTHPAGTAAVFSMR